MSSKRRRASDQEPGLTGKDRELFETAWETTWQGQDRDFTFYLPGMIKYGRERGRYPALSITGPRCDLQCEHCKGKLLDPMLPVVDPHDLPPMGRRLLASGALGVLLTGGSNCAGEVPWQTHIEAIKRLGTETGLYISAHSGFISYATCKQLKGAGVTQALVDVMGDEASATRVYHLRGLDQVVKTLGNIKKSGLELVPHIVAGLYFGKIRAEYQALEIIRAYEPASLVFVVLTPLKGTPMAGVRPPSPLAVARLIAKARLLMPQVPIALGCERPRNTEGRLLEKLAIRAGANRMAIWSGPAVQETRRLGLVPRFQPTCCSVTFKERFSIPEPFCAF